MEFSPYQISWLVLFLGSLVVSYITYQWLRKRLSVFSSLCCGTAVALFFLVPAPVPGYSGYYAPAYIVLIFEAFFQIDGSPAFSGQILMVSLVGLMVVLFAGRYLFRNKR